MSDYEQDFEEIERRMNIHRLKKEAEEIVGGPMTFAEEEDAPPEIMEDFWHNVLHYEKAPWTTHFKQLAEDGLTLPSPEEMDDEQLSMKLWQMVDALAKRRVFLESTDHLSDRELYAELWRDILREPVKDLPPDPAGAWHIDLVGSGSEEDVFLGLKYFWDEAGRARWHAQFPDYEIPPREAPPYDRDRHLPHPTYDFGDEEEDDDAEE